MGDVYWGVHLPLAAVARRHGLRMAVETGTYFGSGAIHLAALFDRVWSIERNRELHAFFSETYGGVLPNVEIVWGDAPDHLHEVIAALEGAPAFFFLDAHSFPSSAIDMAADQHHCRVREELGVLADAGVSCRRSMVVIDDADMFLGSLPPPFRDEDFPSITDIVEDLRVLLDAEYICVLDDVVVGCSETLGHLVESYRSERRSVGRPTYKRVAL